MYIFLPVNTSLYRYQSMDLIHHGGLMDSLRLNLERMNLDDYSNKENTLKGRLSMLSSFLNINPRPTRKAEIIDVLYKFYTNQQSAAQLYNRLGKYEKDLIHCTVYCGYRPLIEDVTPIAKVYNFQPEVPRYGYYPSGNTIFRYFPKKSLLYAFYVYGSIPDTFKEYLNSVTPAYTREFTLCEVNENDFFSIIGREERYKDFDTMIRFVNTQNVSTTKVGGYISKSALLKFYNTAGFSSKDELLSPDIDEIQDIKNAGDTTVCFAIVQLLRAADVLDIVKDKLVPSTNAIKFANFSVSEKAKFLFDAYMGHKGDIITESFRISTCKLRFSRSKQNLSSARKEVVMMLKECPVNEWISFSQFSKEMRKSNRHLFDMVGEVLIRNDYDNSYYNIPGWNIFEHGAISIMLMEYMATLGVVDVLVQEVSHSDYEMYYSYETSLFRITELGAYLLGITDTYSEKQQEFSKEEKGFIVQPNFDIIIPNGKNRMQHELFFDRFMNKTTNDTEVSVYKLDFKSILKAVNIGLLIREIYSYCETFSDIPIPDNIKAAFEEWDYQSKRIKIRTVSIVESDDPILLEEIKNYRGMDSLSENQLSSVLILSRGSEKKVKTLIEKNKRFCILEK